jgi:TonB family protein
MFKVRAKEPARATALLRALALALAVGAAAGAARADSWAMPGKETYYSPNRRFAFEVTPKRLESQLKYFSDKVEGRPDAGAPEGLKENPCTGALLVRRGGSYFRRTEFTLVNEVSPVGALVADSGRYVVTFDNWHSVGYGPDVVVIYRADGTLVGKLGLEDLLTASDIETLPHSVSSIWWGGEHYLDEGAGHLVLRVVADGEAHRGEDGKYHDLRVSLATGRPVEPKRNLFVRLYFPDTVTLAPGDAAPPEAAPGEPSCLPAAGSAGAENLTPVSSAELAARAEQQVMPRYPPIARAARARGQVVVEVLVDEGGGVACARAAGGHPLLRQAAVNAVRAWKFKPGGGRQHGRLAFSFGATPPDGEKQ